VLCGTSSRLPYCSTRPLHPEQTTTTAPECHPEFGVAREGVVQSLGALVGLEAGVEAIEVRAKLVPVASELACCGVVTNGADVEVLMAVRVGCIGRVELVDSATYGADRDPGRDPRVHPEREQLALGREAVGKAIADQRTPLAAIVFVVQRGHDRGVGC
jgi:hypothetical protein